MSKLGRDGRRADGTFDLHSHGGCESPFDDEEVMPIATAAATAAATSLSSLDGGRRSQPPKRRLVGVPCGVSACLACLLLLALALLLVGRLFADRDDGPFSSAYTARSRVDGDSVDARNAGMTAYFPDAKDLAPCDKDPNCLLIQQLVTQRNPHFRFDSFCRSNARDWLRRDSSEFDTYTEYRILQRYALAVFFCETDGPNWLENRHWLQTDTHECDWFTKIDDLRFDTCNENEEFEVIRLEENQLQGTLPSELSLLTSLFEITVSDNLLYGTIPAEYAALTDLDTLCLSLNLFDQGPIPELLFAFEDMEYLDFAYNSWTGTIPASITATSPNIRIIYGEYNSLSGTIPPELGHLPLQRLSLSGNALSGLLPLTTLQTSPRLERLYVHQNNLNGTMGDLDTFIEKTVKTLTTLALHGNNHMQGTITNCGGLVELSVSNTDITCACCT